MDKAKAKGSIHNIGRLNAYSYHVFDNRLVNVGKNQKFFLADSWYPISAQEHELVILRKVYALCEGLDGNPQYIQNRDNLYRLFLTSDYFMRDDRFFQNEHVYYRTKERYESFVRDGYLSAQPFGCISITFHGLKRMEVLLNAETKDSVLHQVHILNSHISDAVNAQKSGNELLAGLCNLFSDYIVSADENKKFTVSDGIGVVSDITTTISNVPGVLSVGQKFVKYLPVVTKAIRELVANFG